MLTYYIQDEKENTINFSPASSKIVALKVDGVSGHEIDIQSTKGLNQIGSTTTNTTVNSKVITIDGVIIDAVDENRANLINLIRPQKQLTLFAVKETGETYKLNVVAKKTPVIGFGRNYQHFQFTLYADYPYWRIDNEQKTDIRTLNPLFRFPRNFSGTWKFSEYQRSEFINVHNGGNEETAMRITIKATANVKNPKLLNVTTGEYIKLNYTMAIGETVTITTGYNNKRVTSSTKGNIFSSLDLLNSEFLQLSVGDNVFKFTADEYEANAEVIIYYDEVVSSL